MGEPDALYRAVERMDVGTVRALCAAGGDTLRRLLRHRDSVGATALHVAVLTSSSSVRGATTAPAFNRAPSPLAACACCDSFA